MMVSKPTCLKQDTKHFVNFLIFPRPVSQKLYLPRCHYTLTSLNQVRISPTQRKLHVGKSQGARRPDRVPGASPGQPRIGWPREKEGFVLQFRACRAEGGNRQSGPSRWTGSHPGAPRPRSPSSRTWAPGLTVGALEIPTSPRTGFHGCPGNRPRCSSPLRTVRPHRPNSPRLRGCLSEPAFPIRPSPHVIRIPPGELANILIHIL